MVVLLAVSFPLLISTSQLESQTVPQHGARSGAQSPEAIPATERINTAELVKMLQSSKAPLMLQVGSHVLFAQAHIPGSEYVGAGSTPEGLAKLKARVQSLPRDRAIILYCGCCPWGHCPNIKPAFEQLRTLGFRNAKVLYLPMNFGVDWVNKGYPVAKGE